MRIYRPFIHSFALEDFLYFVEVFFLTVQLKAWKLKVFRKVDGVYS